MSSEITTLLAKAAPAPGGPPDVGAIITRGNRVRARRMVATALVIPVIAGAIWAGAYAGSGRDAESSPAGIPSCEWSSRYLMAFLVDDVTRPEIVELTDEVAEMDEVESVEWHDIWGRKETTFSPEGPHALEQLSSRGFPPWLDIRLDDPAYAGEVADVVSDLPLVEEVAGQSRRESECRAETLERENEALEEQVKELLEELEQKMRRVR